MARPLASLEPEGALRSAVPEWDTAAGDATGDSTQITADTTERTADEA